LLLIRGILAALRQKIHLTACPNSPGHLSVGGSRPLGGGTLNAYVHGPGGVLTLHGASINGPSLLSIGGDIGATVENDGRINIEGGANTGSVSIETNLAGTGTISGGGDYAGDLSSIYLGGSVGAGETINLTQTNLELNAPMSFAGTLTGFSTAGFIRPRLTLDHETITGVSFQQSSSGSGSLSVATQDPSTGAAGSTMLFHVAGDYAADAFAFTGNKITLA